VRSFSRFGIAALVSLLISSLVAFAGYSFRLWMGLKFMIYISAPFAILIGVSELVLVRKGQKPRLFPVVVIGTALAILYTCLLARFALGIPVFVILMLSCWIPSGIAGMVAANSERHLPTVIGIAILCLSAIVLMKPIFNSVAQNQQLTVAFITPSEPSTAQIEVRIGTFGFLNEEEIQAAKNEVLELVRGLGYTQPYRVLSITRVGEGRKSLAIIMIRTAVSKEVILPVPDSAPVLYAQESGNWVKKPMDVPVLRRGIALRPPGDIPGSLGFFVIPDAKGSGLLGMIRQITPVPPR
jgi:hypothetical protein